MELSSDASQPSESSNSSRVEHFQFTGKAGEFFGIWFVNHTLTWLTLGIYSAWAKVRTLQYFYGNTSLAEGYFHFTAKPTAILRGRIIAFFLFLLYIVSDALTTTIAKWVAGAFVVAYIVFAPLLVILVLSFRARYSEWRGIKFRFYKNYKEGYWVYLQPILLQGLVVACLWLPFNSEKTETFLGLEPYQSEAADSEDDPAIAGELQWQTSKENDDSSDDYETGTSEDLDAENAWEEEVGVDEPGEDDYINPYLFIPSGLFAVLFILALPYFDFINQRFYCRNLRLGTAKFAYNGAVSHYYKAYVGWLLMLAVVAALWGLNWWLELKLWWLLIGITALFIPATQAYIKSIRYNLLLNHSTLAGKYPLQSNTRFLSLFWLMLSNSVVIALTFGFMTAWAKVRTVRYFLTRTAIEVEGEVSDIVAGDLQDPENPLGEEVADMFDLDVIG